MVALINAVNLCEGFAIQSGLRVPLLSGVDTGSAAPFEEP
jgi:hypothetical protein